MAVIIIDQKPYEVDQQKNLLESAISLGLDVPYFCWHPALGSVGSCRLCAVQQMADENDTVGRTVMSCMTPVKDQARFSIVHPVAKDFREAVVEWLMTNHPHDCPVCDEGGECHLQDMTVASGHNYRQYRFPKRTFRNQNLGPFVNHEMNRCITCYRCVRYYRDLSGGSDLSAFKSSGKVYFGRFSDGSLESEFSGNLVEICPTGVFTDKVYHQNYVRKWDLATSPSLCQLCGVGCNISLGERAGILRRVQNRYHHDINGFFICDRGRFGHEFVNSDRRIPSAAIKKDNVLQEVAPDEALGFVRRLVEQKKNIIGIGSPTACLEANWLLKKLVGADNFYDGLPAHQTSTVQEAHSVLKARAVEPASLKDVREADAVVIIGEDLTNTAPMMALSIRQASMAFKQRKSKSDLDISLWNDAAVKDFARGDLLPVFSINAHSTSLDQLAHANCFAHPFDMPKILFGLLSALKNEDYRASLTDAALSWIARVKEGLLSAKNPVIIAGSSLGEPQLIRRAFEIACVLDERKDRKARLSLVMPDANSIGFSMLDPKPLASAFEKMATSHIDVAIVLEHDLRWRLGSKAFHTLCQSVKHLVVIDSLNHETTKAATVVLPSLSFLESTGSMVSAEGRLQRYFGAAPSETPIKSSVHNLTAIMGAEAQHSFRSIDDICREMAADLGIAQSSFDKLYGANFRVMGQKIPTETSAVTGRTAIKAHLNMHEQKPLADPDSPLTHSMEGARKKIPLPLLSSSWAPAWNSVQASFKSILSPSSHTPDAFGGVRLFAKENALAELAKLGQERAAITLPSVYVVPKHHVFASFMNAKFSSSLATRIPAVEAEISPSDASLLGFSSFGSIVLETSHGKFSLLAKTKDDVPPGVILLPFGLVDASLFFSVSTCRVVSKEQV